jgi:hypothetical protein
VHRIPKYNPFLISTDAIDRAITQVIFEARGGSTRTPTKFRRLTRQEAAQRGVSYSAKRQVDANVKRVTASTPLYSNRQAAQAIELAEPGRLSEITNTEIGVSESVVHATAFPESWRCILPCPLWVTSLMPGPARRTRR